MSITNPGDWSEVERRAREHEELNEINKALESAGLVMLEVTTQDRIKGAIVEAMAQLKADWVGKSGHKTAQQVWDNCERGDWMLWLLGKLSGPPESKGRKKLVLASCGCARLALKFVKDGEHRPRICIEIAEAWAHGKATIEQVREARSAATYAADAAAADAAAYAAAYAAYAAAYAARKAMLKECARAVREHYPKAPRI